MKTMMRCLVVVFCLITVTNAQWVKTSLDSIDVYALAVLNEILIAGTDNGIFISDDNGNSWTKQNGGLPANISVHCFAIKNHILAGTDSGVYYFSDIDTEWIIINNGLTHKKINALIVSDKNIFAGTNGGLFVSINNGTNWTKSTLDTVAVLSLAVNGNNLFAGTTEGLFLSSDNGVSWVHSISDTSFVVESIIAVPKISGNTNIFAGICINTGLDMGPIGGIKCSTDNGTSWKSVSNNPVSSLAYTDSIIFAGTLSDGTIISNNTKSQNNPLIGAGIICSRDYGNTWQGVGLGGYSIYALAIKGNNLFAVVWHGNGVWRRPLSEMIPTSVKQPSSQLPENYSLSQNYPNPFNPSTVISYQLPVNSIVILKIYDLLGGEIATLVNEEQSAGWKEVEWNASSISSGVYFYKLQAGLFQETKRMILMK